MAGRRGGLHTKSLEEHLADLYAAHAARAVRLAYLLTGDAGAAEDISQEAFARVGGRLLRLREPDRAAGYLLRTVMNLSRGHGRRLERDRRMTDRLPSPGAALQPDLALHDEVSQAVMKLPLRQRAAIFCRYFADLTESQTAEILDCSVGAARSLTFRAMETLRAELQEVER